MNRTLVISLIITTLVLIAIPICNAESFSASYKIKVHIPAVVGINVLSAGLSLEERITEKNSAWETTVEEIVRENEAVILKTTVLK